MQTPAVLVTSRRVQNVHTGLDLTVPQHQEVRGKMMSGHVEYQILVVTRLAAFKSAKHRPEDVVQFLVSKKYSEIEEFYQKLSSRYAAASLPPLPRKVLFVGESDIRERRAVFNEILRCVSKDAELAGSPELLEFLGTRPLGTGGLTSRESSVLDDTDTRAGDDEEAFDFFEQQDRVAVAGPPILSPEGEDAEKPLEEEEEEEEVLDPLGIMRSKKPKTCPAVTAKPKLRPSPRLTIFDEEVDPEEGLFGPGKKLSSQRPSEDAHRDTLKLFDDPDLGGAVPLGDPLLLPATPESVGPMSSLGRVDASEDLFRLAPTPGSCSLQTAQLGLVPLCLGGPREGPLLSTSPLCRVEEDLDQILNLGAEPKPQPQPQLRPRPQPRPKPLVAAKPALPKKPAVPPKASLSEAVAGQQRQQVQIQAMDEVDILQYIRDHDTPAQAAPSLF
ncbi:HCLS1-binding protein 3 isoform X1 [Tupaia chinensis]|uniref:HCLS1-binding protein 3 isoform X1 n=1 Tax=Tupaia chinensis TaxID=246437 RepID=UPI0003C8C507|nr:HCLS1-binding protein 3 isoform X1 [Tupaia chinensis]